MKDKNTLLWLYQKSKKQLRPMIVLIVLNALYAGCGVLFALACRSIIDTAVKGNHSALLLRGFYLFFLILFQFIIRMISKVLETRIQGRLEMGYKSGLFETILKKDYMMVTKYHSGELLNRLTADISVVSEGITTILPEFAGQMTKLTGAIAVLCVFDPLFALVFAAGGIIMYITARYFRGKLKYLHKQMQEKDGFVRSFMQEAFENLIIIKIFGIERRMQEKSAQLQTNHYHTKMKKNMVSIVANSGFAFTFNLGYVYALIWGSNRIATNAISFGTMTAVLQLVGQVQAPFTGLSGLLPKLYGVLASTERMMELESLPDEAELNSKENNIAALYTGLHSITFSGVSFQYDRDLVLDQADLTIRKGDFMMISGISGIGKSTLLKLLLGVLNPLEGDIYIRMKDESRLPVDRNLRRLFAYVPQRNLMLSGTIRENITLFNPEVTEVELIHAATVSCAYDFIKEFPLGFQTMIGEKGQGLSEGQLQRIAIARAILCGAPVLLLDESTSALDEATEESLLNNLMKMTDKTCIIISHKKAALSVCNKEIRIEDKKIIALDRKTQNEVNDYLDDKIVI